MPKQFDLLVLGKSGSGKSSTGNSILDKSVFPVSNGTSMSHLAGPLKSTAEREGCRLSIVDGLDICQCGEQADFRNVEESFQKSPDGFSAFLLVIKFGDRFGEEDRKVIEMTKAVFGNDAIQRFGICVLTYGDNYKMEIEDADQHADVNAWFEKQPGFLKYLYLETNKRCVMFDNKTKTEKDRKDQVHTLIQLIKKVNGKDGSKYTSSDYSKAESGRNDLTLKKLSIDKKGEYDSFVSDICKRTEVAESKGDASELMALKNEIEMRLKQVNQEFGENSQHSLDFVNKLKKELLSIITKIKCKGQMHETKLDSVCSNERNADHVEDINRKSLEEPMQISNEEPDKLEKSELSSTLRKINKAENELLELYRTALHEFKDDPTQADKKNKLLERMTFFQNNDIGSKCQEEKQKRKDTDLNDEGEAGTISATKKICKEHEITLLLLGSAGNGKSATGNSILGKVVFKTTASTSSNTSGCNMDSAEIGSDVVTVIDCPGLETDKSPELVFKSCIESVEQALELCDYTFSSLIIVLKYGQRFTKQESETIKYLKGVLGKDVFKNHGICVVTHGDNYEADNEDENIDFIDWCKEQGGEIQSLFEECKYRCVLLNNKTRHPETKTKQIQTLLNHVPRGKVYTAENFIAAFNDLKKMKLEYEMPRIIEETNMFLEKKRQNLAKIDSEKDPRERHFLLEQINKEISNYEKILLNLTDDAELIDEPLQLVHILLLQIKSKLKSNRENKEITESLPLQSSAKETQFSDSNNLDACCVNSTTTFGHNDRQDTLMTDLETHSYDGDDKLKASFSSQRKKSSLERESHRSDEMTDDVFRNLQDFERRVKELKTSSNQNHDLWSKLDIDFTQYKYELNRNMTLIADPQRMEIEMAEQFLSKIIKENVNKGSIKNVPKSIWEFLKSTVGSIKMLSQR